MTELTIIPASGVALPAEPFRARHLIDGAWTDSGDGATSERHSPAHGDLVSVAAKGWNGRDAGRNRRSTKGV
jgi:betaine-aldehyde dehydrogenase